MSELRLVFRRLWKRPGLSVPALLVLAVALGTNTLVFALLDSVFLRPLPFRDPQRLVMVWQTNAELQAFFGLDAFAQMNHSAPGFRDLTQQATSFDDLAAYRYWRPTAGVRGTPRQVRGMQVSAGFFELLGVEPLRGTTPTAAPDERLAVVSSDFWRRALGSDAAVVGEPIRLDGVPFVISGVMPPGFDLPPRLEAGARWSTDVWTLVPDLEQAADRSTRQLYVLGRLRDGVTVEQAEAQLAGLGEQMARAYPDTDEGWGYWVETRRQYVLDEVSPILTLLFVAVTFVVLIAAANLVGLLLSNLTRRAGEIEIQGALGAPPGRLRWQLIGEALALAIGGAVVGLLLAWFGVEMLGSVFADLLPRGDEVRLRATTVAYGLLLASLVGLYAGAVAARHAVRGGFLFGRTGAGGRLPRRFAGRARWLPVSIVLQSALSFVLLVGAGLLGHSLWNLTSVDTGFRVEGAMVADLSLPPQRYSQGEVVAFVHDVVARLEASPQIESAGAVNHLPITGIASRTGARAEGMPAEAETPVVIVNVMTPGYLDALGVTVHEGRDLELRDTADSRLVAVVNRSAAEMLFAGRQVVGRELQLDLGIPPVTVVGVVADHRTVTLSDEVEPAVYLPLSQYPSPSMSLLLRSPLSLDVVEDHVRSTVWKLDPQQPVSLRPLAETVASSVLQPTVRAVVLGALAGEALLLATIGLYGLLSFLVGCRRLEMGIRLSLGSSRRAIASLVLRSSLGMVTTGIALGLVGTMLLHRLVGGFLFDIAPTDPATHLSAAALLLAVAFLASLIPTYRATRVAPSRVLQAD